MSRHPRKEQPWHSPEAAVRWLEHELGAAIVRSMLSSVRVGLYFEHFLTESPGDHPEATWLGKVRGDSERDRRSNGMRRVLGCAVNEWFYRNRKELRALGIREKPSAALALAVAVAQHITPAMPHVATNSIRGNSVDIAQRACGAMLKRCGRRSAHGRFFQGLRRWNAQSPYEDACGG